MTGETTTVAIWEQRRPDGEPNGWSIERRVRLDWPPDASDREHYVVIRPDGLALATRSSLDGAKSAARKYSIGRWVFVPG